MKYLGTLRAMKLASLATVVMVQASGCSSPTAHGSNVDQGNIEWPGYGLDANEQRFSPATQIGPDTIGRLGLAWSYDLPAEAALEATPLEVAGTIFFSGSMGVIYAVDAVTGKEKWTYDPEAGPKEEHGQRMIYPVNRGVAYWDNKVYVATRDGRIVAVDAGTGKLAWSQQALIPGDGSTSTGAPRVFKGKVIIGNSGAEVGARGYVTALDAKTGKFAWRFFTVPGDPSKGFENEAMAMAAKTWSGEWWKYGGGGTPWNAMTYDAELNQILIGTGNGGPYASKFRAKGMQDNLFVTSVVALDPDTGKYKWHYQYNPLDVWDYKATMDIVLTDLTIKGQRRKVLMQAPSNGFFYVIDRTNGKLISAEKIGKVNWAERIDLKTGRPVENPDARYEKGPYTVYPGLIGAHNWQAMAYNPQTGLVYIPYIQLGTTFWHSAEEEAMLPKRKKGFWNLGVLNQGAADPKDPMDGRGSLLAWDPVAQKLRWRVDYKSWWNGGVMTTATNLVFQGLETGELVAYDGNTGKRLWSFDAKMGIMAPPITYTVNHKQYVSVLAGYGGTGGDGSVLDRKTVSWAFDAPRRLLTFALDAKGNLPKNDTIPLAATADLIDQPGLTLAPRKVAQGEYLYNSSCVACHGVAAKAVGGAPDLRASAAAADRETFGTILKDGALATRGMPRFDDLNTEEVDAVYQYIRSTARAAKANGAGKP